MPFFPFITILRAVFSNFGTIFYVSGKMIFMKKKHQAMIALGIAAIAAGLIVHELLKDHDTRKKISQLADEGYETALDILFPEKEIRDQKLHFGPVLPEA